MADRHDRLIVRASSESVLDRVVFRLWLEAHRDEIVGRTCDEGRCPLARWLSETQGLAMIVDGDECRTCDGSMYPVPHTDWSGEFMYVLDVMYPLSEVTGAQALLVLDGQSA